MVAGGRRSLLGRGLDRRALLRAGTAGLAGLALGGGGLLRPSAVDTARAQGSEPIHFPLVEGWYRDRRVRYYDFGANTPFVVPPAILIAPIYVFVHGFDDDDQPILVEGQHNIVNVVPGDIGYSDLWAIDWVIVPQSYQADSVRSLSEILFAGFGIVKSTMFVNCPIVPEGSTLETGQSLIQGWYRGEAIYYPDYGPNPATAIPIYAFFRENGDPVAGQQNIIDRVPPDPLYSDFWHLHRVTVPDDYEANSIRSQADVLASGYPIEPTTTVVNCPVVQVDEEQEPGPERGPFRTYAANVSRA